jgi:hypothetical protein
MVLDCIASALWVDMKATGVDVDLSAAKGLVVSPSSGL